MPRAIVSSRPLRRRIPSRVPRDANLWTWDPSARRGAESRLAPRWMSLLIAGISALVALHVLDDPASEAPRDDGILWLDEPPPSPLPEPVSEPPRPPVEPRLPAPEAVPLDPTPEPVASPDPDPAFGLDEAVETGGLAVATGGTLAKAPDPVVREIGPPPGPVLLESVPGSTRPVVPRYPPRAEALGLEARVVALVTTDTLGNVVGFRIEKSGGRDFDESVRQAALTTRFSVPVRDGRARAVAFRMPYSFRLE